MDPAFAGVTGWGTFCEFIKIKKGINLLAGRAITFRLDPFDISERLRAGPDLKSRDGLERILTYGDLPEIAILGQQGKFKLVENLLRFYVETFLEEEVRSENLVREIGLFGNFLRMAAEMSGKFSASGNCRRTSGLATRLFLPSTVS